MIPAWLSPLPWAVLAAVQFRLLGTGQILSYLHPKAVPLAWVLAGFCAVAAALEAWALRQGGHRRRLRPSVAAFAWMLPLLAIPLVHEGGLSSRAASSRGLLATGIVSSPVSPADFSSLEDSAYAEGDYPVSEDTTPNLPAPRTTAAPLPSSMAQALPGSVLQSLDTIPDADFTGKVNRIWQNPAKWRGRSILLTGFVTKDETFGPGGFFLTRMLLSCCAADAMPVGFFCQPVGEALPEGQWITVVAKVGITSAQLEGWKTTRTVPLLSVLSYARTEAPENPYVYPFSFEPDDPSASSPSYDPPQEKTGIP